MRLSTESIESYENTGWYISDYCLSEREIEDCVAAAERMYRCEFDHEQSWTRNPLLGELGHPYEPRTKLRVDQFPSFHSDTIRRVVHSPVIAQMCAQLLRAEEVRYYKDILIGAPVESSDSAIGWHMDMSYWPTCVPERMITVYVPLQDRDESNGTLLMISGSHRWANRNFNLTSKFDELERLRKRFEADGHEVRFETLLHRRGQVSFHSSLVLHATFPNRTLQFQHSIVFGLQAQDNRHVPSPLKRLNPRLVINLNDEIGPRLPDGTPDLKNGAFYPVLFRERERR